MKDPQLTYIVSGEGLKALTLGLEIREACSLSPLLFNTVLARAIKQEKEI